MDSRGVSYVEDTDSHDISQHSSVRKDNNFMKYDSVPLSEFDSHVSQPASLRRKTSIFGWWKYELLAHFISIGSIMALALVARHYEGRPLADINLPSSLQLSSIIAALSTVTRVALLVPVASAISQDSWLWLSIKRHKYNCQSRLKDLDVTDNASRGPWGSVRFLFSPSSYKRLSALVGAVITILSLGLSVFTQQLVVYEVLPMADGIPSLQNIPRSTSWTTNEGIMDAVVDYVDPAVQAAIITGFFTPNVQPLSLTCPTGNCTWPVTPSLAVCGGCTKTSPQIECDKPTSYGEVLCNFTVPSGSSFQNGSGVYFESFPGTGSVYNSSDQNRLYLANWDVGGVGQNISWESWNATSFMSYECALWNCVQSYSASVQSSTQNTTVVNEWSTLLGTQNSTNSYLLNATFGDPSTGNTQVNASGNYTGYTIAGVSAVVLQEYLLSEDSTKNYFTNGTAYMPGDRGIDYSNNYIQVMYNATQYGQLDVLVKNIALSMTNVFRSAEPAQNVIYNGTASTLSVAIKWKWLTLPIILVAASLVLSLVNIVRTYMSGIGAYKGSPLALLVCDVDPQIKAIARNKVDVPNGLIRSIGNWKAYLAIDENGDHIIHAG